MTQTTLGHATIDGHEIPIEWHEERGTIELRVDSDVALLQFTLKQDVMSVTHTEVPPAFRGRKIGDALATAALDLARGRGWTVRPYCPFVGAYVERHPDYRDLIDPAF